MIKKLEEIIHNNRKNKETLKQRFAELDKKLHIRDKYINYFKIELYSC